MHLVLCHTTADFDTLGAAVGLTRLHLGSRIVLTGGCHPDVQDFLALHRDEYPLIECRSVNPTQIHAISVVDTQQRDRLGKAAEWLDLPGIDLSVYDHHLETVSDIPAHHRWVEAIGSTTTLIVERLQVAAIQPLPVEATVMALGIHVDTGSLTFDHSTPRDVLALAWLMQQGASLRTIAEYVDPGLSPQLQALLTRALTDLQTETIAGYRVAWLLLAIESAVQGLSSLTSRIMGLTDSDTLLLAAWYPIPNQTERKLTVIGRSRIETVNLNQLLGEIGGGGHPRAAAATCRTKDPKLVLDNLVTQLRSLIPHPPVARELMSSPVRTIRPETTIDEAQRILLRYGHSGLSVVNANHQLVGIISRRDLDIALHHGFGHAPVKGYMSMNLKTIVPDTTLPEIEDLMVTYDVGRLPVLDQGELVGIVTRTDVLRQLHSGHPMQIGASCDLTSPISNPFTWALLAQRLAPELCQLLAKAAELAIQRGWQLYLVGGAVRDLLLTATSEVLALQDIDLVVDGCHRGIDLIAQESLQETPQLHDSQPPNSPSAAMELAEALGQHYPTARLQIHGQFQTAALLWHQDPQLASLWVDIATARTEFYPYPGAHPQVTASSIQQDLYRRDFTINALAIRLTSTGLTGNPRSRLPLLDFFGGVTDLQAKLVRVLHPNSFIEDPTRIYRAVRFAVRLGFRIESQTEQYIRDALTHFSEQMLKGVYDRSPAVNHREGRAPALQTRLKSELKYILQAPYWRAAVKLLADLGALKCLHPTLVLDHHLWWQLCLVERLQRYVTIYQSTIDPALFPTGAPPLILWETLLEVLIAHLSPDHRGTVARNLQLPHESIDRLVDLDRLETSLSNSLSQELRPSQIVTLLNSHKVSTLVLIGVRSSRPVRKLIWRYLIRWAPIKPPLDGNDLKAMGYKPGQQFRRILDALLTATLDGEIHAESAAGDDRRQAAIDFLAQHYPLHQS